MSQIGSIMSQIEPVVSQIDEYNEISIAAMDFIWGEGFMAPGGEGNVDNLVSGLDLQGKWVLDIGCGQGRPACILAEKYGAHVIGIDLEAHLIERSKRRAKKLGLDTKTQFYQVEQGPLLFSTGLFDVVISSGAFTQIDDKLVMYKECLRVLKPGGVLSCYDWMKTDGPYSKEMLYWFELEGLTYAMETKEKHVKLFAEAGFSHSHITDKSSWYRQKVREEYEQIKNGQYFDIVNLIGKDEADKVVENWRVTMNVCEKEEMLQAYSRAHKKDN
jgi:ubiquinone/menaquinone biosynthesis C-methylase UbiE